MRRNLHSAENNLLSRIEFFLPKKKPQQKFRREQGQLLGCGKRTEFGARLHDPEDGVARDDAHDLGRAVTGAAHDGHLIDVRA
jgi:hypothetical protein